MGPVLNATVTAEATNATIILVPPEVVTGVFTYDIKFNPVNMSEELMELNDTDSPITIGNLTQNTFYVVTVSCNYIHLVAL